MSIFSKCRCIRNARLGTRQTASWRTSQLCVKGAMRILNNTAHGSNSFVHQFIQDKNVLEIADGGYTELVEHLSAKGATATFGIDRVPVQKRQNACLHLVCDIFETDKRLDAIRQRFFGDLPDTVIVTSIFGAADLSYVETKRWLKQCTQFTAPGGVIILDFLMTGFVTRLIAKLCFRTKTVTRDQFEHALRTMKSNGMLRCWSRAEKPNCCVFYKKHGRFGLPMFRPPSFTYKICV